MGRPPEWAATLTGRAVMKSPGRPPVRRDLEREFWAQIALGLTSEDAAPLAACRGRWVHGGPVTLEVCRRLTWPRPRGGI